MYSGGMINLNPGLWEKIAELEHKLNMQEKKMKRAIMALGEQMSEDFDFDNLLDDLETEVKEEVTKNTPPAPTPEAQQKVPAPPGLDFDELDNIIDNLDETEVPEPEVVVEPEPEVAIEPEPAQDIEEVAESVILELEKQVSELKAQVKALKNIKTEQVQNGAISALPELEYSAETRSFLKEYNAIEFEKKALNEKTRQLKDDYKDMGVSCSEAIKAQKEKIKELKETSEQAELIEGYKNLIGNDDDLMGDITMLAG